MLILYIFIILLQTAKGQWKILINIYSDSGIGLADLWLNTSYTGVDPYRSSHIDSWNEHAPSYIRISAWSKNFGRLILFQFNTTHASSELTSWLTTERLEAPLSTMSVLLRKNDIFIIYTPSTTSLNYLDEQVWFAHMYTTTFEYTTVFTKNGLQKHVWKDAVSYNFGTDTVVLFENSSYFQHGVSSVDVIVNPNNYDRAYISAFEFLGVNGSGGCTYTIDFSISFRFNYTLSNVPRPCDGERHNVSLFPASSVTFKLSTAVNDFQYKLYSPADDLVIAPNILVEGFYDAPVTEQPTTEQKTTTILGATTKDLISEQSVVEVEEISTKSLSTTGNIDGKSFTCQCSCNGRAESEAAWNAMSTEQQDQFITESVNNLTKELSVDTTTLSNTIRQKTSASDDRISSQMVGYLGIAFLSSIFALILIPDIVTFGFHLYSYFTLKNMIK